MSVPLIWCLALNVAAFLTATAPAEERPLRVAAVGGLVKSSVWPEVLRQFEALTGRPVEVVLGGQRDACAEALRAGEVDVATMHSGDAATELLTAGFGINLRPWALNEMVIVGPASDPALVRGLTSGAAALKQIATVQAAFVDSRGIGSHEQARNLWRTAGVEPVGSWVLKDESEPGKILEFAAAHAAYVLLNRLPLGRERPIPPGLEILVQGDPAMRRAFVVVEANSAKLPSCDASGARQFSDYLCSSAVRKLLATWPGHETDGPSLLLPIPGG